MSEKHSLENYTFIKTIGEGTFGKVKLAIHKPTKEHVAIKILEKTKIKNRRDLERIKKEIKYMKMLNHPNIVKIYELIEDDNNFYIAMEYVSGGELFNYIVKNKRLEENEASFFYSQIIHIIQEIHKHKICHRDLKPENLLLTQNKTIKIIDFGLSNEYDVYLKTPCGSPCYASPEVIKGLEYSGLAIDLWASGIILYSMLCGYLPFDDKNNENLFRKILKCKVEFPTKKNIVISETGKDLIKKILKPDPSKRISLEKILEHPFLVYGNKKYKERINMDINKQDKLIIEYMVNEMKISNDDDLIRKNIISNKHNKITTIFNLLKKKYNEGRFNYNKLQKKDTDNFNRSRILDRFSQSKLNKTLNTDGNYSNNGNSIVQDIGNIIKKNNNNIIIINNNNNLVNQPHKMNYIINSLYTENKDTNDNNNEKYKKMIKKIDTSISVEKSKKENSTINTSHSPGIDSYKSNAFQNSTKIREKRIFYKKYVNTSLNQNHINLNQNDSTFKVDSFNIHLKRPSNEKNVNLNLKGFNEYKKKVIPSSHLKTLTNLQFYNLNNAKEKDTQYNTRISLKNKSLINNSLLFGKNEFKKLNASMVKRNPNQLDFYRRSPDNKVYKKYVNYFNYVNDTSGNTNYEKLNEISKYTNKSLLSEIKKELNHDNYSMRNSINPKDNLNYRILKSINTEDEQKSLESLNKNSKRKISIKNIMQIGKENYYKKLNVNKSKDDRKKIKVNKLVALNEKTLNNNTYDANNNLSERERYPKSIYINKTINNESTSNTGNKRLKFKIKELTEKKKFNNSLAYSKKICTQNKSFSKSNNNFYIIKTDLSMYQISNRISNFCTENELIFNQTNNKYTIMIEEVNSFIIDMKPSKGSFLLKFTHDNGEESKTKEYMIKLYSEIAK